MGIRTLGIRLLAATGSKGALAAALLATALSPASGYAAGANARPYHGAYSVRVAQSANTVPTVEVGANVPLGAGGALSRLGSFSDPDAGDTWRATVDYGDGSGAQPLALSGKQFKLEHVYAAAGRYTLSVSVSDDRGGVGMDTLTVSVVEATRYTQRFVTGGGTIASRKGACALTEECAEATGKANFQLGARYDRKTRLPIGKVHFWFRAGDLRFRGAKIESLAITGARAEIEARGTVNRSGGYTIRVTAVDVVPTKKSSAQGKQGGKKHRADRLRIKITDDATGAVVYDTQMGATNTAAPTAKVKGAIKIHRPR